MKPIAKKEKTKAQKGMSKDAFAELELSLNQALDYQRGEREGFRVTDKPVPATAEPKKKTDI